MMNLLQYKNWAFTAFTVVAITMGVGYFYASNLNNKSSEMVSLADLSDADIDLILEVKKAMYAASIESY
jgi:sugar phosphate permease